MPCSGATSHPARLTVLLLVVCIPETISSLQPLRPSRNIELPYGIAIYIVNAVIKCLYVAYVTLYRSSAVDVAHYTPHMKNEFSITVLNSFSFLLLEE